MEKGLDGQIEISVSYRSILRSQSKTCYRVLETLELKDLSINSEFPKHTEGQNFHLTHSLLTINRISIAIT